MCQCPNTYGPNCILADCCLACMATRLLFWDVIGLYAALTVVLKLCLAVQPLPNQTVTTDLLQAVIMKLQGVRKKQGGSLPSDTVKPNMHKPCNTFYSTYLNTVMTTFHSAAYPLYLKVTSLYMSSFHKESFLNYILMIMTTDTHPFSPTIVTAGIGSLHCPPISTHAELPESSTRGALHQY